MFEEINQINFFCAVLKVFKSKLTSKPKDQSKVLV
jgi:hypothetical protein